MDLAEFTGETSSLVKAKYGTETSAIGNLLGIPVAVVADMGISIWNSMVPQQYEYDTQDVLSGIHENLANIYTENEDTVKALSFVGGIVLPGMVAAKGMNLLRAGVKGVNWFSTNGATARLAGIKAAYEGSGKASTAFRTAMWKNRFATAGNALVDAAVYEGVLFATLNAHPYMEDYVKDPLKNAALGIAMGTGILGVGGFIAQRAATKGVMQEVAQASYEKLLGGAVAPKITDNLSGQLAAYAESAKNWQNIVDTQADTITQHTRKLLEFNVQQSTAKQFELLESMIGPKLSGQLSELPNNGNPYRQHLIDLIISDPLKFQNIDNIRFATVSDFADFQFVRKNPGFPSTILPNETIPFTKTPKNPNKPLKPVAIVYNQEHGTFMRPEDLRYYGGAVDMGYQTVDDLLKKVPNGWHRNADLEIGTAALKMSSPAMDTRYLQAMAYFDRLGVDELLKPINIGSDDLPMLQGFLTRIKKEVSANVDFDTTKLQISLHDVNGATAIDLKDAFIHLQDTKLALSNTMTASGIPAAVVSKHLNIPVDTVEMVAQRADWYKIVSAPVSTYNDAALIPTYLDPTKRSLILTTNKVKIEHAQIRSNIAKGIAQNSDDLIKEGLFATSQSSFIREWATEFFGQDFRTLRDVVRSHLSLTGNEFMGMKFFTSSDHALRNMKEIGPIATQIGKNINEMHLQATNKFFAPVKDELLAIARDPAALTEFNIADRVNAGLKGVRTFQDNKFWYIDPDNPTKMIVDAVTGKEVKVSNYIAAQFDGVDFEIKTPAVQRIFEWINNSGQELYNQATTLRKVSGNGVFSNTGFWMPSWNPKGKYVAYVINKTDLSTTLLHAKTPEDLQEVIRLFSSSSGVEVGRTHDIVEHGTNQKLYNIIAGRHDPMFMQAADLSAFHSGASAAARVSTSSERLVDVINAYEHQLNYNLKSMAELQLSDVMNFLDRSSEYTQASVKHQPGASGIFKRTEKDAAAVLRNTFLGNSNIDQSYLWKGTNQIYTALLEKGLGVIADIAEPILNTGKSFFGKGKTTSDKQYEVLQEELARRGIPNVFAAFDDYEAKQLFHLDRTARSEALAPRLTVLTNTLAATTLLRIGEIGQAYVNAISLPILMTSEISSKLPAQFMNAALEGKPELGVIKTIINGWRYAHRPEMAGLVEKAKELNLFKGVVSEADELFRRARSIEPGVLSTVEDAMRSKTVEMLSKATDFSEQFVREKAFATGAYIAKTSYPTLPDSGVMLFARDFMDRVIGNYTASQRPIMFQGTFGVAMGLFQTYMLTMAQSLYRHLERGEFKALAKVMLAQNTIFGARSLPGFNLVSQMIGEHFSDDNFDLTTGTFRALPDQMAEAVLYGLPSSFSFAAITTRGELQPRIPDPTAGINAIPAVNLTVQAYDAMRRVASSVYSVDKTAGQGIMEALSLQSISRPIARMSELASGHAITQKGNLIAGPEEIWTGQSVFARLLSTRPISEVRARDAVHLNTVYGSIDRENRQNVVKQLRTHLRGGTLNEQVVADLAEKYMRTGSPSGWNSAVNNALAQTELPIENTLRNYLAPNSPTMMLIDNMH